MVTKEELLESLQYMVSRVENPDLVKHFQSFDRTMLMSFKDLGLDITIVFDNGTATVTESTSTNPDLVVVTDSETITGILGGSTSAMRAFMSGKIKVEGPTKDLLKIQRLLKA
jgi:putative sterol carrier protein